ncbi:hypothetical protein N7512_007026 [Penicillium capsulatum]|nr:hypothetical protein N7512_007026 [Penicillium capsulatum]
MSGFGKVMKEGWHPKSKEGKSESWRGDFKGINQVAGWMGKGKDTTSSDRSDHVSQPLSSLKDPASFAPPPKNVNFHGPSALPNETTPDRRGLGAPVAQPQYQQDASRQSEVQADEEVAEKPKAPSVPYRVDTTGLSTNHLPPPPVRRMDSPSAAGSTSKPKPQLPPRLPPRNESVSSQDPSPPPAYTPTAPSPSQGYVNQDATSRLANAGVSVPALGIGETQGGSQASTGPGPVNELQSRFSQMRTDSGSPSVAPSPPARASRPYDDGVPAAASPGFRERHADKIDFGKQKLGGVTSRINTFVEDRKFSAEANKRIPRPPTSNTTSPTVEAQAQRKKAPPPPPPKRASMRTAPVSETESTPSSPAPPIPLNTKPR